jgi:intraflagellar transport protein 56
LSIEVLSRYLQRFPNSLKAVNVKACNVYRLCDDGKAALEVIETCCGKKAIRGNALLEHNAVVFQDGQRALHILPNLVGKVPEARLNLAIYYLKNNEKAAAAELMDSVEANCPPSHALLGILSTETGQANRNPDALAKAQSHFQSVGSSPTECDTILGRQCMASSLILLKEYGDALVYLGMIHRALLLLILMYLSRCLHRCFYRIH